MSQSLQLTRQLVRERRIRLAAVLLLLLFIFLALIAVENLMLSIVCAMVLNYLLAPFVNKLERQGVKRVYATVIPFAVLAIVLTVAGQILFPLVSAQIESFRTEFPTYIDDSTTALAAFESRIQSLLGNLPTFDMNQQIRNSLFTWTRTFAEDLPSILSSSLTTMLLTPFLAFFLLLDGREMTRRFLALVPNAYFELFLNLFHQINRQIGDFFRARILEAVIVGLVVACGLFLIGFPYAALLSLFAAITNLIPYVGPLIGAVPAVLIALVNDFSSFELFLVFVVYMTAHIIDAVFIIPVVVAKIVNLHPVLVVLGIIIGAEVMGVIGMIISIPLASALKVTTSAIYQHLTDFR